MEFRNVIAALSFSFVVFWWTTTGSFSLPHSRTNSPRRQAQPNRLSLAGMSEIILGYLYILEGT
jgi:hypothetical protein